MNQAKKQLKKIVAGYILLVVLLVPVLQKARALQLPIVSVSIYGSNTTYANELPVQAITAYDAVEAALVNANIAFTASGDNYINDINGERDWLYSVNEWTPGCTPLSGYQLSGGERIVMYAIRHQYGTPTHIQSSQTSANRGEEWSINVESKPLQSDHSCTRPAEEQWKAGERIPVTVTTPTGKIQTLTSSAGKVSVTLDEVGSYTAQVWSQGYMPSNWARIQVQSPGIGSQTNGNPAPSNSTQQQPQNPATQQPAVNQAPTSQETQQTTPQQQQTVVQKLSSTTVNGAVAAATAVDNTAGELEQEQQQTQQQMTPGTSFVNQEAERAIEYLLTQQDAQGLIGGPETNSWALLGMSAAAPSAPATQQVLANHEAYLTTVNDLSVFEVEKQLLVAVAFQKNPKNFAGINMQERFLRYFDGTQFGTPEAMNDDIWALVTMGALGYTKDTKEIQAVRAILAAHQNEDGGFGYAINQPSDSDDTAAAIMALLNTGSSKDDAAIQRAFKFLDLMYSEEQRLLKHQGSETEGSAVSTAWALQAYRQAGQAAPGDIAFGLQQLQQQDGSIKAKSSDQQVSVMATALTLQALTGKTIATNGVLAPLQVATTIGVEPNTAEEEQGIDVERHSESGAEITQKDADNMETIAALQEKLAKQQQEVAKWKRMNTVLILSIIAMGIGIAVYGIVVHTNIGRKHR